MKMADAMDMKGRLIIQQFNPAGELVDEVKANNFIVYSGRDLVAKMFLNQKIEPIRYLAIGTGSNPVNPVEDTALQKEVFRKEVKPLDLARDLSDADEIPIKVESGIVRQKKSQGEIVR